MSNYGLPYMGSKNKIVADIVPYMLGRHPDRTIFVDLFGGGVSVTDYILKNTDFTDVIYNDFDSNITALVDFILNAYNKTDMFKYMLGFCDRDMFNYVNDAPDTRRFGKKDIAIIRLVYSFGNRGDTYLYGKDIELYKEVIHYAIIDGMYDRLTALNGFEGIDLGPLKANERKIRSVTDLTLRRTFVLKYLYDYIKPLGVYDDTFINRITTSEHLARIERLASLFDGVTNLGRITTFNMDYRDLIADIEDQDGYADSVIVYCDPPYEDTAEYMVGAFDSNAFWDWVRSTADKYPVYVSSYKAPPDILCVWEQGKRGLFAMNSDNNDKVVERIYYNGYSDYTEQLFDMLGG